MFFPNSIYQVQRGQVTRRVLGSGIQFATRKFWSSLATVGAASTVASCVTTRRDRETATMGYTHTRAPAVQVAGVDLLEERAIGLIR
jgi:hypothetical protein